MGLNLMMDSGLRDFFFRCFEKRMVVRWSFEWIASPRPFEGRCSCCHC